MSKNTKIKKVTTFCLNFILKTEDWAFNNTFAYSANTHIYTHTASFLCMPIACTWSVSHIHKYPTLVYSVCVYVDSSIRLWSSNLDVNCKEREGYSVGPNSISFHQNPWNKSVEILHWLLVQMPKYMRNNHEERERAMAAGLRHCNGVEFQLGAETLHAFI